MTENNNALETHTEQEAPPESHTVVGVRFRTCGKIYTFEADDVDVAPGSQVVVDSEMGLSIGHVVTPKHTISTEAPLKKVIRIATDQDFETVNSNRSLEDEAKVFCIEKVKDLNLPMKIVATETTLDRKRLIFYFTADGRIDFRELVRDLAAKFKTRIEMRQIGVRDEVKMIGGFGACGRQTCCSLFLTSFEPITIRMAKEQELSINQSKLSGICGRLMCCLGYEYRDPSTAEEVAPPDQDESLVTVPETDSEESSQMVDSGAISAEPLERQSSGQDDIKTEEKEKPAPSRPEKQASEQPEKGAEEKKHHKRVRRRRKKRKPEKPVQEQARSNKPETGHADSSKSETKEKGRPFNRRKKFWKKKKH